MVGYKDVKIPEGKKKKDYNVHERRAEILKLMLAAGHPKLLNQQLLADIYGVSHVMIFKDVERIKIEFTKDMGNDAQFVTQVIFNGAMKSLAKGSNADKYKAAMLAKTWNDWLFDLGAQKRTPIQTEDVTEYGLSDAYKGVLNESRAKKPRKKTPSKRNNKKKGCKVPGKV